MLKLNSELRAQAREALRESGLWQPLLHLFIQQLPVDYLLFL